MEFILNPNTYTNLKPEEEENLNFSEVAKNSYYIIFNNKYQEHFIPSLYSQLINSEVKKFIEIPDDNDKIFEFTNDIEDIKNEILYNIYRLKKIEKQENFNKIYKEMINSIINDLKKRKENLLYLKEQQDLSEIFYNKTLKNRINLFNKLGISFALSNFLVFYSLIYKFYAWDVIEPITYIVGNVYWIITLGFLVFSNKKLGFDLIESQSIMEIYSDKIAKRTGFDIKEKLIIENELQKIEDLMKILEDLNNNNNNNV